MLAKNFRLTKQSDFDLVYKRGGRFFSRYFGVRYLPNNLKQSRFAIVVANRVSKRASKRNLLKRQVREIVWANVGKIETNYDFIINVLSPALKKEYQELEQDLLDSFKKKKII